MSLTESYADSSEVVCTETQRNLVLHTFRLKSLICVKTSDVEQKLSPATKVF